MPEEGVSVVVMAFNEAPSLGGVVREIHDSLRRTERRFEIVVVDDGSTDETPGLAEALARELSGVRALRHGRNLGLGGVYRTGFVEAHLELLTFFPADGQFPASIIGQFAALMADADMVLGYVPRSSESLLARALSSAERMLYRLLFGPLPRFQGILMFRRDLLEALPLTSEGRGWAVVMELVLRAARAGCRIRSVPTQLRPRRSGVSKVRNWRTVWANLRQLVALRARL